MSFHIDRAEFDEWVKEGAFDRIWAAYEYACNGGETSLIDRLKQQLAEQEKALEGRYLADTDHCNSSLELQAEVEKLKRQRRHFIDRGTRLEAENKMLKDFQKAKEETVKILKAELECAVSFHDVARKERDLARLQLEEGVCYKCRERERIMASLPQDGSRGQKDAWDELLDRISMLEAELDEQRLVTSHVQEESETFCKWYEKALTYAGLPTTPEQARKEIEE